MRERNPSLGPDSLIFMLTAGKAGACGPQSAPGCTVLTACPSLRQFWVELHQALVSGLGHALTHSGAPLPQKFLQMRQGLWASRNLALG